MLALLLAACGGPAASVSLIKPAENPQPTAPPPAQWRVALIMKTLTNPFFAAMERGARQAETELGVELIVLTGSQETSVEQQISNVRRMIEEQVDAIVIAPADSANLVPVLQDAQEAGIVVVNIDNRLDRVVMQALSSASTMKRAPISRPLSWHHWRPAPARRSFLKAFARRRIQKIANEGRCGPLPSTPRLRWLRSKRRTGRSTRRRRWLPSSFPPIQT
jgi:hypothetical protein